VIEKGSFDHLNSSDGYVSGLGLSKAAVQEAENAVEAEEEEEKLEKEAVLVKIASVQAQEKAKEGASRGKRNADALFQYIKSMGKVNFPIFCIFTIFNIGFRSAQREQPSFPTVPLS
jgi:ATP-binding cassette, subfamily C (CFTR/MRP), member 1